MSNPLPNPCPATLIQRFEQGDYAYVALYGSPDDWRFHAARALVGRQAANTEALEPFAATHVEARFHQGAAFWMEGKETQALRVLDALAPQHEHARRLAQLIRKPRIRVLSQCDRGSQWDFVSAIRDDAKFEVTNVGFDPNDKPNRVGADVRRFIDENGAPDFYIAKMVEWHLIPKNLRELGCPLFGQTADYDLHLHAVLPWFSLFDELLVTDATEWQDVKSLTRQPVTVFPKAFGLGARLPDIPRQSRPLDVFISGTTSHPYHPDKSRLLHQVLGQRNLAVKFIDGFLMMPDYLELLGRSKAGFTYIRHPGGMPTRGLEFLAMGAAIAVQKESVLQAYLGEEEGVFSYSLEAGDLPVVLRRIAREWDSIQDKAHRGAAMIREQFKPTLVASQYFRFLTFVAARPREVRRALPESTSARLRQKRSIFFKGWAFRPVVNRSLRQQCLHEVSSLPREEVAAEDLNDAAREMILEFATAAYPPSAQATLRNFNVRVKPDRIQLNRALELLRCAIERFPDRLVLHFNLVRAALHLGEPREVREGLRRAMDALEKPSSHWKVTTTDDVYSWDFFPQFFDYRSYFDLCTHSVQTGQAVGAELVRLILSSLGYYLSHYGEETLASLIPGSLRPGKDTDVRLHFAQLGLSFNPRFAFYQYRVARLLVKSGEEEADRQAADLLVDLADHSMLHLQAADLLDRLVKSHRVPAKVAEAVLEKAALARERLHRLPQGNDDWEAVPLKHAAVEKELELVPGISKTSASVSAHSAPAVAPVATSPRRILYFCLDFAQWQYAKRLAYPAMLGVEDGLRAQGAEVILVPAVCGLSAAALASWQKQIQQRFSGQRFDQVWVEMVHSEWGDDFWSWLGTLSDVRVGLVMESLQYEAAVYAQSPHLLGRQEKVEARLAFVTHALCIDEADGVELERKGICRALWWPQTVPARFILKPAPDSPDRRALFSGSIYGQRDEWLKKPELAAWMTFQGQPGEEATEFPARFDELQRLFERALLSDKPISEHMLGGYIEAWRRIREACFAMWLEGLQAGGAVINLPSYVRSYAGRVFEAMAAGRPVLSWEIPDRPQTTALFQPGAEILLFQQDQTASLIQELQRLQQEPGLRSKLVQNAQRQLAAHHTSEARVEQIQEWIATGARPNFRSQAGRVLQAPVWPRMTAVETVAAHETPFLTLLARVRLDQKDYAQAQGLTRRVLEARSSSQEAWLLLGQIGVETGDLGLTVEGLSKAFELDPRSLGTASLFLRACRKHDVRFPSGDFLARMGSLGPEDDQLQADVLLASLSTAAREATGQGDGEKALARIAEDYWKTLQQSEVTANSGVSERVASLGSLDVAREHFQHGRHVEAWNAALEAIRIRPFHPEAWLFLAGVAAEVGDVEKARKAVEQVRQMVPRWRVAKEWQQRISKRPQAPLMQLEGLEEALGLARATPRLTVCFITRNEERFLRKALESVKGVASQIVVTDTGSTDGTLAIAAEFGAEISHFTWCDDFAAARNAALENARGDWILVLDADEELTAEGARLLSKAMKDSSVLAWRLPLRDVGKEKEGCHYIPRLFRNVPGAHFKGRIHEHPFNSLHAMQKAWSMENKLGEVSLLHHGYTDQVVKDRSKVQRNLRLLGRAIEEDPEDVGLRMSYGLDLIRSGHLDAGLEEYGQAFKLMSRQPEELVPPELRERLLTLMATHLITGQRFQNVIELSQTPAARATGPTASLHLMFGVACYVQKRFAEAESHFRSCLAKRTKPSLSPVHSDIHTAGPAHLLALCLMQQGKNSEVEKAFRAALKEEPTSLKIRLDFIKFLEQGGHLVPALQEIHQIIQHHPGEVGGWRYGADIALRKPEFIEFALDWTREAISFFPRDPKLCRYRAQALLLGGRGSEAAESWATWRDPKEPDQLAEGVLLALLADGALPVIDPGLQSRTGQEFCHLFRKLVSWGAEGSIRQIHEKVDRLGEVLPQAADALRGVFEVAKAA